jgi:hypothetical protein
MGSQPTDHEVAGGLTVPAPSASSIHPVMYTNATVGLNAVHRRPAMPLEARLPRLCTPANRPNAEPRIASGAKVG